MDSIRIFLCYKSMRILSFWSDILLEKISESSSLDIQIHIMFHFSYSKKNLKLAGIFVMILISRFLWKKQKYALRRRNSRLLRSNNYFPSLSHPEHPFPQQSLTFIVTSMIFSGKAFQSFDFRESEIIPIWGSSISVSELGDILNWKWSLSHSLFARVRNDDSRIDFSHSESSIYVRYAKVSSFERYSGLPGTHLFWNMALICR